jgi:hypothetical protein
VIFTATDDCGNTATATVTVTRYWNPEVTILTPSMDPVCGDFETNKLTAEATGTNITYKWIVTGAGWSISGSDNTETIRYIPGNTEPGVFLVTVTDEFGCVAVYTITLRPCEPGNHCTYTQGFYGNEGGMNCGFIDGQYILTSAYEMMKAAMAGKDYEVFGTVSTGKAFMLHTESIVNRFIFDMLPGGGTSAALKGIAQSTVPSTWANVPLSTKKNTYGKILNNLVSQTITLFFNMQNDMTLGNLAIKNRYLVTADAVNCGSEQAAAYSAIYVEFPMSVLNYLGANNTVNDLYNLANRILGGEKLPVSASDVTIAIDAINNAFDECRILIGFYATYEEVIARLSAAGVPSNLMGDVTDVDAGDEEGPREVTLLVYPNPFSTKVFFNLLMDEDSQVKLEIYNQFGSLIKVILDDKMLKGDVTTVEFDASAYPQTLFIYKITTNSGTFSGHLIKAR